MKRIAVITGGGSYGAYHCGTMQRLGFDFDEVLGTSVGGLQAPLVALGKYNELSSAFKEIGQYDVFNGFMSNPIKKNGKINVWKAGLRLIRGKKSIGATDKSLERTIRKFYTKEDHKILREKGKVATVCAVNLNKRNLSKVDYFTSYLPYERFIKAMRATASFPGIMSPVNINGKEYVDGGLTELGSVEKAFRKRPDELHIFAYTKPVNWITERKLTKNFFHFLMRMVIALINEVKINDLDLGRLREYKKLHNVSKVKIHWMKESYTHMMVFNKKEMEKMHKDGFDNALNPRYNFEV